MGKFVAVLVTVFLLGATWVYAVPMFQAQVPTSWTSKKYAQVGVTGAFLLLTVFVVSVVLKTIGVQKTASA